MSERACDGLIRELRPSNQPTANSIMNSNALLDFHSLHFSKSSKESFLASLNTKSDIQSDDQVSLTLSPEIIQMFQFSQDFKRKRKKEIEEESQTLKKPLLEKIQSPIERFGENGREIQDLEKELHENGLQFIKYHVWPVMSLSF